MRMLGKAFRMCPYGKHCSCNPPGFREAAKKQHKRREKQQWKREIWS